MKTVCTFFAVGLIFLCCTATLLAQSPEKSLENIKENYQFEKIFVHYDKAMYSAGETIWFKAYVMEGIYPSGMSSTIYLTLTNDSGGVVAKKILPIIAGSAVGEFTSAVKQKNQIARMNNRYVRNTLFAGDTKTVDLINGYPISKMKYPLLQI